MSRQIYLDNAATTPIRQEVAEAMQPYFYEQFGNPSSIHHTGQVARQAIEQARLMVADYLNAAPAEVVFTAGGTEADFLALTGVLLGSGKRHLITTQIEHHAVLHTGEMLEDLGYEVTYVPPMRNGVMSVSSILEAIRPDTGLVSMMWVNNETGAIQPVKELALELSVRQIPFHVDAVQALGILPIDVAQIPVSLLSFSGHKIYGPKGTGALYIRKGTPYRSMLRGGAQERNRRAGTENVAGIVGFAKAVELLKRERDDRNQTVGKLRALFLQTLQQRLTGFELNSPKDGVPNVLNLYFHGVNAETLLMRLDLEGIAASGGSACTAGSADLSHVLLAMGLSEKRVGASLRFSFSSLNTAEEVALAAGKVAEIVEDLRTRVQLFESTTKS